MMFLAKKEFFTCVHIFVFVIIFVILSSIGGKVTSLWDCCEVWRLENQVSDSRSGKVTYWATLDSSRNVKIEYHTWLFKLEPRDG